MTRRRGIAYFMESCPKDRFLVREILWPAVPNRAPQFTCKAAGDSRSRAQAETATPFHLIHASNRPRSRPNQIVEQTLYLQRNICAYFIFLVIWNAKVNPGTEVVKAVPLFLLELPRSLKFFVVESAPAAALLGLLFGKVEEPPLD